MGRLDNRPRFEKAPYTAIGEYLQLTKPDCQTRLTASGVDFFRCLFSSILTVLGQFVQFFSSIVDVLEWVARRVGDPRYTSDQALIPSRNACWGLQGV